MGNETQIMFQIIGFGDISSRTKERSLGNKIRAALALIPGQNYQTVLFAGKTPKIPLTF